MTADSPNNRVDLEKYIKDSFAELQENLGILKNGVVTEQDETKKQKINSEIQKFETELTELQQSVDNVSSLEENDLQSINAELQSLGVELNETRQKVKQQLSSVKAEVLTTKETTPTTYELLKGSGTRQRLVNIIRSNPTEFTKLPWNSPEAKLEYIFTKIRNSAVLFLKNKLWESERYDKVINETIAPAIERNLMELLRDQWNEANISMLQRMDRVSWESFNKLVKWVSNFAKKTTDSFNQFSSRLNALDYLAMHNTVLLYPENSAVLTSPVEFQSYLNHPAFKAENFSPYIAIPGNVFKIDKNQTFEFGLSTTEKLNVLLNIWNIQVVDSPKTTALITKMIDKPEQLLKATDWLQETANSLLNSVDSANPVLNILWIDLFGDIAEMSKKKGFLFRALDFVLKLIWITWWVEGIIKKRRLDKMKLTDEKNENISQIFWEYRDKAWENEQISITNADSCKTVLQKFTQTNPRNESTTKWDFLRDSMLEKLDVSLVSPGVVQEFLWNGYLKQEEVEVKWEKQNIPVVDSEKITDDMKMQLVQKHIDNMRQHLVWNYEALQDFYKNINSVDDLALCITASLYADKNDIIEWIKAKVFLPENYVMAVLPEQQDSKETSEVANTSTLNQELRKVILVWESGFNYWAVNKNDVNGVSLWLMQWHKERAAEVLKEMKKAAPEAFARIMTDDLFTDLDKAWDSARNDKQAEQFKLLMEEQACKDSMDRLVDRDCQSYIDTIKSWGVVDEKCIIVLWRCYNGWSRRAKEQIFDVVNKDWWVSQNYEDYIAVADQTDHHKKYGSPFERKWPDNSDTLAQYIWALSIGSWWNTTTMA